MPTKRSSTKRPMLLCRTSWLAHYDGRLDDDVYSNHRFVREGNTPGEILNFLPTPDGRMEGYVKVPADGNVRIDKHLGAARDDDKVDRITVVWCAQHKDGRGIVVVGWYEGATVFRAAQDPSDRGPFSDRAYPYRVEAQAKDCRLLTPIERTFVVQEPGRAQIGAIFGQADLGYIDEKNPDLRKRLDLYIETATASAETVERDFPASGETDPERNAAVERAAEAVVIRHFKQWQLDCVQKDNKGWDLEFRKGAALRRVEVKGRSVGLPAAVRLSPNEERAFNLATLYGDEAQSYRLAIVTGALTESPTLLIFRYVVDERTWVCELTNRTLQTASAGIFATPTDRD